MKLKESGSQVCKTDFLGALFVKLRMLCQVVLVSCFNRPPPPADFSSCEENLLVAFVECLKNINSFLRDPEMSRLGGNNYPVYHHVNSLSRASY
jgi:hypothetical protein